jgi:hypothetical protein
MFAVFYFAYTVLYFLQFLTALSCSAMWMLAQMALNVNLPENMKGRTPSWGKQRVLFSAQVVFEGKRPS